MLQRLSLAALAVVALSACAPSGVTTSTSSGSSDPPSSATPAVTATAIATPSATGFDHIVVVVLENAAASAVEADPTFANLAAQGARLTKYYGIAHHSLPDYLALTSGVAPTDTTRADCPNFDCPVTGPNLAEQLTSAGINWRGYFGGTRQPCLTPVPGQEDPYVQGYLTHHNPFAYYPSVGANPQGGTAQCKARLVGLDQFGTDAGARTLPRYSFVAPDSCDDGHDAPCADGRPGGLKTAMKWVAGFWSALRSSASWTQRSLLVVTFDEGADGDNSGCCGSPGGGRVATVLLSAAIRGGTTIATPSDHYSLLRTVEDAFGLPHLGGAATATPISGLGG